MIRKQNQKKRQLSDTIPMIRHLLLHFVSRADLCSHPAPGEPGVEADQLSTENATKTWHGHDFGDLTWGGDTSLDDSN